MKHLEEGDILYKLVYYPEIYLDIYYVNSIVNYRKYDNTMLILTTAIIGEHSFISWIECTVNIDKLIKRKSYSTTSEGYFLSTNQELILKRLAILLKYQQKCIQ